MIDMLINKINIINVEVIREKKPKAIKEKPLSYRELAMLENEEREEAKRYWLENEKFVADCVKNEKVNRAYIKIYDVYLLKEVISFEIRLDKVMESRMLDIIKKDYRITITKDLFYDINENRIHPTQESRLFLL